MFKNICFKKAHISKCYTATEVQKNQTDGTSNKDMTKMVLNRIIKVFFCRRTTQMFRTSGGKINKQQTNRKTVCGV